MYFVVTPEVGLEMIFVDDSTNSLGSSMSNFSIRHRCKAHRREISNNFNLVEKFRNDLIEEEILMENYHSPHKQPGITSEICQSKSDAKNQVSIDSPLPKSHDTMNLGNMFDVKWAHQSPSIILPRIRKLLKNQKFQPYIEVNSDLSFQSSLEARFASRKTFQHPEDFFKFLLKKSYHSYTRTQKVASP